MSNADDKIILMEAISNDLRYILTRGDSKIIKIWDYETYQLITSIDINDSIKLASSQMTLSYCTLQLPVDYIKLKSIINLKEVGKRT